MLIGGWGPRAHAAVLRAGRRPGMEIVHRGPLALAAPTGSLQEGQAGSVHLWLSGRAAVDDLEDALHLPTAPVARLAATAFDRLGPAAQAHLHGQYLLVTLHDAGRTLRVSHDHLGARTLNYVRRGEDTYFAEHVVDLLALLPSTPPPDRLALVQWIDRQMLPLERSLFAGVARLAAGQALELAEGSFALRRFWRPTFNEPAPRSRSDAAAAAVAAAYAAIERAATDLARPAVKLSGGLDSACVAAGLSAASVGQQALALSGTFPGYPESDESTLIAQTARTTGLRLVEIPYSDVPIVPSALAYVRRWMLPPSSPNHPIWERLMNEARALGVDGLLDGEGGDELFSVAPYLIADRLRAGRLLAAWRLAGYLPGMGQRPGPKLRWITFRVYGISGSVPRSVQRLRHGLRESRAGIGPLVRDADIPALVEQDEGWTWKTGDGPLWWRAAVDGLVNAGQRLDASGELARDAVVAGLDRRHPFMHDARLIEAVLTLPPEHQFDPVRDRPLLRDGLLGAIPEAVRTRYTKSHFDELVTGQLSGAAGEALARQVAAADSPVRDYVRTEGLDELATIRTAQGFRRHRLAKRLFCLTCVDSWLRCLTDRASSEEAA